MQRQTVGRAVYQSGNDRITDREAVLQGKSYDLGAIDSVSLIPPIMNRSYGFVSIGIGAVITILGYFVWQGIFLTPMLAGIALMIAGIVIVAMVKPHATVRINHTNGSTAELRFPTRAEAEQIVDALSLALQRRRVT
jgi:uncharacterized protein YjeT (DUF2065 family)